jgi:hypothetical protein
MEHKRGAFKVNLEITPLDRQKELQRLNLRSNSISCWPGRCQKFVPVI